MPGWTHAPGARKRAASTPTIPFTVDDAGFFTAMRPGFGPDAEGGAARVIDDNGKKGDANERVIKALIDRNTLFARGRLKHTYPHSWRSKKPVIFRNTPQWFVYMDKELADGTTLRSRALAAIDDTRFVPAAGQNRLRAMIEEPPGLGAVAPARLGRADRRLRRRDGRSARSMRPSTHRILEAFEKEGADAWFAEGAKERFLGNDHDHGQLDAGHGHPRRLVRFRLDAHLHAGGPARPEMAGRRLSRRLRPASRLVPFLAARKLRHARPRALQRRRHPWLHHGREGREDVEVARATRSSPQDVIKQSGADILRLWVVDDGLLGRPAPRQDDHPDQCRRLPQAAQHHPLDARHAGA